MKNGLLGKNSIFFFSKLASLRVLGEKSASKAATSAGLEPFPQKIRAIASPQNVGNLWPFLARVVKLLEYN